MLKNHIKLAWRNLIKKKTSSLINVLGLTVGITVCLVILIFVQYESTFDTFHERSDRTFRVVEHNQLPDQVLYWNTTAYPLAAALRNDFPQVDEVTQVAGPFTRTFKIETTNESEKLFEEPDVMFVDAFYPKTFDVEWLAGNGNTALTGKNSIVLTERLAQRYYGLDALSYQKAIGKTILLQGKDPLTVTGVVKNPRGNSDHQYGLLVPYEFFKENNPYFSGNWSGNYQGSTYLVLKNVEQKSDFESKLANWKSKYLNPQDDQRISYFLQPITEIHNETLYGPSPGGYILPLGILKVAAAVALFILLIALINFVNLVTAQSHARSKEVGVRKVMGSSRTQLISQFVWENSLIIVLAATLSIALTQGLLELLNNNLTIIDLHLEFRWIHLIFVALIVFLATVMAAIYPAVVLSAYQPIRALRNKIQNTRNWSVDLRKTLVTVQFVIVQLFVIAAIILAFQMDYFNKTELGFKRQAVLLTENPDQEKSGVYRERLMTDPNISKVAFGSGPPMAVNGFQLGTNYRLPKQAEVESLSAEMKIGDIHYLDFYGLELLAGRNFTKNKEVFDEFIVNETLLKPYGWTPDEAIGKTIQINEGPATIVGVVRDFHNNPLQYEISPCILLNWTYYMQNAFIELRNANGSSLENIQEIWESTYSNGLYKRQFLNDAIAREYAVERLIFTGFTSFSIVSILLGCLGLFGLMSFIVTQKRKEIGIRKVLGATVVQNIAFFSKKYIRLVALSFLIAAPLVYYFMNIWLQTFTYRIQPSIWMFLFGGTVTFLIALVTCSAQSIKAARANPIHALKEE